MDKRKKLALIFGGCSKEHEVSVVSARSVFNALDRDRYEIVPMAIDFSLLWAEPNVALSVLEESEDRTDQVKKFAGTQRLDPRLLTGEIDVAFPVLHGPYGEDGKIQGLFEMLKIPYVGCDATASAVCMNKILTKRLLQQQGIPTPAWEEVAIKQWESDKSQVRSRCIELGFPMFVKPASLGSSVGISKVEKSEDFEKAISKAFGFGAEVIVEQGVRAREIEVAVLGNDAPQASIPGEIVAGHDFYDYEDKYLDSKCELLAPAPLSELESNNIRKLAIKIYSCLGCEGMARVDLFSEIDSGKLWVNEVNTIPGFTSISMYPKLWKITGLPYSDLLDELVRLALERAKSSEKLQ